MPGRSPSARLVAPPRLSGLESKSWGQCGEDVSLRRVPGLSGGLETTLERGRFLSRPGGKWELVGTGRGQM